MKINNKTKGFSLFELVLVLGILLIVLGIVFSGFTSGLRTFRQERAKADRDADLKRALELMSIELGQAGVTPNLLNEDIHTTGPKTNSALSSGATTINFVNHNTGLYPRRPIILELPENATNSENLIVNNVTSATQITLVTGTTKAHANNVSIGSPSFPNMFGILNPSPTTAALTKTIIPQTSLTPVRIGFFGDILGNGSLFYVEYTYEYQVRVLGGVSSGFIGRLRRSITLIDSSLTTTSTKNTATTILQNVTDVRFTLVYPSLAIQVPHAVRIEIEGETSAPISGMRGGSYDATRASRLFNRIRARTEVYLRGTGSAANIIAAGGEPLLRAMMPTCNTASAIALPPCPSWTGVPWWEVIRNNFAGKNFNNTTTENLP